MILKHKIPVSLGAIGALLLFGLLALYTLLRASLPALDGSLQADDLGAPVSVDRDRLGVVTVTASSRTDLAYATGFVHAQDRFFQMDLSRRLAAGELAELVGAAALEQDRSARKFRFRSVARAALSQTDPSQRAIVEAYARGVNAGLASLGSRPWEYWLLGAAPAPWLPEDTILVTQAMWWDLQSEAFPREILRQQINQRLGGAVCAGGWKCALSFFYPARTEWDAPDDGAADGAVRATSEVNDVPAADVLDLRHAPTSRATRPPADWSAIGSNNWAIAGRLTRTGAALVASDMHLTQRVPATWYHMRLRLSGSSTDTGLDLTGVTLPGAPVLVAGSNGHIAWGFTNSYGAWFSVTRVACSALGEHALTTAAGPVAIERTREAIRIHNSAPVMLEVVSAAAGVLLRADPAHQACWFGAWLAQQPAATNLSLIQLERATSAADALRLAPEIGIPHQNLVVGDAQGHIGWSIAGRIPRNIGPGRALGDIDWTDATDQPRLLDPPLGRIWTANGRVSSDPRQEALIGGDLATLGAEYDLSARAQQIREDLLALAHPATPADMLPIQLDDRALLLNRWRNLLLRLIDSQALEQRPERAEFRRVVGTWTGHAAVDSSAYRLVRAFRSLTQQAVWNSMLAALDIEPDPEAPIPPQFEHALWQLVSTQPEHLLDPRYRSWRNFLLAELDATVARLGSVCPDLGHCTWGQRNTVAIRHPLSGAVPLLWRLIDMPVVQLPGDNDMPRVQDGATGASERFAVSPGHEAEGYFHMPGGQSGHPLSPYYRAGFMAWARGQPLP
ncbi:MAG: penicillin acylase family protein, partial [Steroidobacteraceae bacterium]